MWSLVPWCEVCPCHTHCNTHCNARCNTRCNTRCHAVCGGLTRASVCCVLVCVTHSIHSRHTQHWVVDVDVKSVMCTWLIEFVNLKWHIEFVTCAWFHVTHCIYSHCIRDTIHSQHVMNRVRMNGGVTWNHSNVTNSIRHLNFTNSISHVHIEILQIQVMRHARTQYVVSIARTQYVIYASRTQLHKLNCTHWLRHLHFNESSTHHELNK